MWKLILQAAAGILSLWLATLFVSGVGIEVIPGQSDFFGAELTAEWQVLILAGACLGVINFFLKPVLNVVTLPLRTLTFGLFSLIVNAALVWAIDVLFPELAIEGIRPLLWTTAIVWITNFALLRFYNPKR